MATLMAVYTSSGCVGRCDARCYNAHLGRCTCICGGKNHGAGWEQAGANTCALAETWLADLAHRRPQDQLTCDVPARRAITQLSLLGDMDRTAFARVLVKSGDTV